MKAGQIIWQQLGGSRFAAMTGARNALAGNDGISFRFMKSTSRSQKRPVNALRIRVNSRDLYDMEFMFVRGHQVETIEKKLDVGVENLVSVFERETGLYTSL